MDHRDIQHEQEIDKLVKDNEDIINELQSKYKQKLDTNNELEKEIIDLKKKVAALENQLQQQQQL